MNILPKKRWHVRTKANIERVRRDEAQAAKEDKERQRRILLAEQEVRTEELRRRSGAGHSCGATFTSTAPDLAPDTQHPNFFIEDKQLSRDGTNVNAEHEREKKQEQEKWERSVGILTYLGQTAATSSTRPGGDEWYLAKPSERTKELSDQEMRKQEKRKLLDDPLTSMHRHLKAVNKRLGHSNNSSEKVPERGPVSNINSRSGPKNLEVLRAERLERERRERNRARQLLSGHRGAGRGSSPSQEEDHRGGVSRYNSQFNPHLARQNYASKGY